MNKLEQQYIDIIDSYEISLTDIDGEYFKGVECTDYERVAKQFVEITKDIAIEFANWIAKENYKKVDVFEQPYKTYCYQKWINDSNIIAITTESLTPSYFDNELFEIFLETL